MDAAWCRVGTGRGRPRCLVTGTGTGPPPPLARVCPGPPRRWRHAPLTPPRAPRPVSRASVPPPRAPGRCPSARRLHGPAVGGGSPLPEVAPPLPAPGGCLPAFVSRPSHLLRHSADARLRVPRVFVCPASVLPPPAPPRPVSVAVPPSSSCRRCLRTVNVRAPRAVPGSRHFIRESARGRVCRGRRGGAGRVRWVSGGAVRPAGGSGVRENEGESTLAIVLIFCMSEGARTTSEGPEDNTHARVAE